jgi:hypothetical protein
MALYKYPSILQQSTHQAFDVLHEPGALAPYSGVYRCEGCGHEIVEVRLRPLPPQNHHQHAYNQGPIRWRLIVTHK